MLNSKQEFVYDVSIKMRADMKAVHYTKNTREEAIEFCNENYGGYDSLKEIF